MVPETVLQAMRRTNEWFDRQVVASNNPAALDRVYTVDARILPPAADMVTGRPAIKEFWGSTIKAIGLKAAVLTTIDATMAGDGVLEIGKADLTLQSDGQSTSLLTVKYVVFWKQENGDWKWHVDIWNPNR